MNLFELFENLHALNLPVTARDALWWPNSGTFEVVIGAILTQQTKWENVEKSLKNLQHYNINTVDSLCTAGIDLIAQAIKPSGFFNQKSIRLQNIAKQIKSEFDDFDNFKESVDREWLLNIHGIGFETADSILCYACLKDVMVIDSYTARICAKIYAVEELTYNELQELFTDAVTQNYSRACQIVKDQNASLNKIYALFHAMIVEYSKLCVKGKNVSGPLV